MGKDTLTEASDTFPTVDDFFQKDKHKLVPTFWKKQDKETRDFNIRQQNEIVFSHFFWNSRKMLLPLHPQSLT